MSELIEVHLTPNEAQELFRSLIWDNVRMISFETNSVTVLLRDNRRVTVATGDPSEAYTLLSKVRKATQRPH